MPILLRYRIGKIRTASGKKAAFDRVEAGEFDGFHKGECDYMRSIGRIEAIPYKWIEEYDMQKIKVYKDKDSRMPYVKVGKDKLFFPKRYPASYVRLYYNSIRVEQDSRSPHYYFDPQDERLKDTVFVDVGGAEGYVSLRVAKNVRSVIILESDPDWIEALKKTFEPWKEKVTIVNQFADDHTDKRHTRLDDVLQGRGNVVLKLDVEGMEEKALSGAEQTLKKKDTKLFVCTYHRPTDEVKLVEFLKRYGFKVELSQGYMFFGNEDIGFRKALARSWGKDANLSCN